MTLNYYMQNKAVLVKNFWGKFCEQCVCVCVYVYIPVPCKLLAFGRFLLHQILQQSASEQNKKKHL